MIALYLRIIPSADKFDAFILKYENINVGAAASDVFQYIHSLATHYHCEVRGSSLYLCVNGL